MDENRGYKLNPAIERLERKKVTEKIARDVALDIDEAERALEAEKKSEDRSEHGTRDVH